MKSSPAGTITSTSSGRDSLLRIPTVLILLCAFFLPWGPGAEGMIHINVSKVFAALAFLLIVCWVFGAKHRFGALPRPYVDSTRSFGTLACLLVVHWLQCVRDRISVMPRAITWFLLYLLVHTFVTYVVVFPDSPRVDRIVEAYTGNTWFGGLIRTMLFAVFAYALATFLKTDRQVQAVAFSMGAGLLITLLISTYGSHTYYGFDVRSAGAFTNANCFGSVSVTVFFLNLVVWVKAGNSPKSRILPGCLILVSLTGCLVSGSRGALFGLVAGLLVMLRYTAGPCRRIRNAVALVLVIMLAVLLVPPGYAETVQARLSIERLTNDRLAGRLDIWAAYIVRMSRYVLTGIGYGRSITLTVGVLPQPHATHNYYLMVLVDLGVVGLLLFVLGLWQVWRGLRCHSRQIGDWRIDAVYRGFFVAWLFLLSTGTRGTGREWWLSLGVIVAYGRLKQMQVAHPRLGDGVDIQDSSYSTAVTRVPS